MSASSAPGANLGQLVNHVARLFRQAMGREAAALGLTSQQAAVLLTITSSQMPVGAVADRLGTDRATMTGVAERLVRDGWGELLPNPDDGRSRLLRLTPRALDVLPRLASAAGAISAGAVSAIPPADAERLVALLHAVASALESADGR